VPLIVNHLLEKDVVVREELVIGGVAHPATAPDTQGHPTYLPPGHLTTTTCLVIFQWIRVVC
jgi:hypothetical protein